MDSSTGLERSYASNIVDPNDASVTHQKAADSPSLPWVKRKEIRHQRRGQIQWTPLRKPWFNESTVVHQTKFCVYRYRRGRGDVMQPRFVHSACGNKTAPWVYIRRAAIFKAIVLVVINAVVPPIVTMGTRVKSKNTQVCIVENWKDVNQTECQWIADEHSMDMVTTTLGTTHQPYGV